MSALILVYIDMLSMYFSRVRYLSLGVTFSVTFGRGERGETENADTKPCRLL